MTAGASVPATDPAEAEEWFVRHGLPYFVPEVRAGVHAGLRPVRLALMVAVAVAVGAAVGGAVALMTRVAWGVPAALTAGGLVVALYAVTTLDVAPIARWGLRRTLASLGLLVPLATRALPLLLLFVTFLFINAEVWELGANLDGGVLWLVVLLFAGVAVGFLLARIPEELERVPEAVEHRIAGLEKANLVLVLLVTQAVQVLLLALSVLAFFLGFGALVMEPALVASWTGEQATTLFGVPNLTLELVRVSVFLAAFSGLYFTVTAVTDDLYRREFFTAVTDELARAVTRRAAYLRAREESRPPGPASPTR